MGAPGRLRSVTFIGSPEAIQPPSTAPTSPISSDVTASSAALRAAAAAFGSAAIATPTNDANNVKRDDKPPADAPPRVEAAPAPGTGHFVDRTV